MSRTITKDRLQQLVEEQERIFVERQPKSAELTEQATSSLAGGATSSWQIARPQMVWITRGEGSKVYDVDGRDYVDLHGGYGAGVVGHAHPAVVAAVQDRVTKGTHFAQPVEDAIVVSQELARRFGLPLWRFNNSGTEATMDAVHLMRAVTGRDLIIKVEGSYHGHHDSVMTSVANGAEEIGPPDRPANPVSGGGIPRAFSELTLIVAFNDLAQLQRVLEENPGRIAGMILEPMMMNAGIIPPEPGYLEGVRELTRKHGVMLTFDEVKTGLTVGPGGMTARSGVTPDLVCLAKSLGGGVPCGAIGGTDEVMGAIVDGTYDQVGTFNGNPLTMAAARAVLTEVLDDAAYAHFGHLYKTVDAELGALIQEHGIAAYLLGFGAKGSVTFSETHVRDYRGYLALDDLYSHAHWLFQHNGGVFLPPWGKSEQWTFSVQHTAQDVARIVKNFERFATALQG